MSGLLVIALLFVVFWFVLIRPQRNKAREQQELIRSLEPGDEIVTAGGLYGVITQVDGEVLHLEIAEGLVIRTARNAVAGIVEVEEEEEVPENEEPEPEEPAAEDGIDPEEIESEAPTEQSPPDPQRNG
jgi:preprotein translocase subunit YajC